MEHQSLYISDINSKPMFASIYSGDIGYQTVIYYFVWKIICLFIVF